MSATIAAACVASAVLLLRPVPRGALVGRRVLLAGGAVAGLSAMVAAVSLGVGAGILRLLVPLAVLGAGLVGGWALRARHRAGLSAERTAARVQEVCEVLGAELASGRPVGSCLGDAADLWSPLAAVATAHRLGASVPDALRELARLPGATDLRLVAAAWHVAHRTGSGLADALTEVGATLRERRATRRLVRSELASARSTARLVASLPLLTLLMGSGAGGDPIGFLFTHPVGLGCLAGGVFLTVLGLWWIETIASSVESAT